MKLKKLIILTFLFGSISAHAGWFGYSASNPKKDQQGELIPSDLADPFKGFILLEESIFQDEQLVDIPGRLVAIAEDDKGNTLLFPYGNYIKKDTAKLPAIKPSQYNYDSYLLDTKSAASIGIPLAESQLQGNYKVEYRFYQGALSHISLSDIDMQKFQSLAKQVRKNFALQKELKLKSIQVISTAAILNTSYAVMQGVKSDLDVSGPGWKVGGSFYSTQQMSKNRSRVGVALVPFVEDIPDPIRQSKAENSINFPITGKEAIPVDVNKSVFTGIDLRNAMKIE
ncbi:hypothetical protein [Acinetobacter sp. ESBL14]|uniref:hypothetical protein n=1 Tax=Acinetobacter sp. ESBL14 TaxID=3077329 RepID=UPI002FCA2A3E